MNFRRGFTLVELLVVMALMAIMATFVIAFFPNAASSEREARAAQVVQSSLNIAKQRALRDQAPRGVRLWVTSTVVSGTTLNNVVTDMQYIEQPDDFSGGTIQNGLPLSVAAGYAVANCLVITGPDLVNGYTPTSTADGNQKYWSVQPGDYLELRGTGLMHRITQVGVPNTSGFFDPRYIVVTPAVPFPLVLPLTPPTTNYRILRAPRPIGDEVIKLPDDTLVDLNTNALYGSPLPGAANETAGSAYDILFAPNGAVISPGLTTDKLHLYVRSPAQDAPTNIFRGVPTVVSVFARTGFVGAYNVDQTGATPYTFVK